MISEQNTNIEEERLFLLKSQDWDAILPKLYTHTIFCCKSYSWSTKTDILAKGFSIGDLVNEAITRVFNGQRQWNQKKEPDFLNFLKGVLNSLIYHMANSAENVKKKDIYSDSIDIIDPFDVIISDNISAIDNLINKELKNCLLINAENDEFMQMTIECYYEGMKREEIISFLELSANKVDYIRKKIVGALIKCLDE